MTEQHSPLAGRTLRCLLFDVGDTLWTRIDDASWNAMEDQADQRAGEALSSLLTPEQRSLFPDPMQLGTRLRAAFSIATRQAIRRHPLYEPDFPQLLIAAIQELGLPRLTLADATAIFEALRIRIVGSRTLFPDALTVLDTLARRGFILGVVTNRAWGGAIFLDDMRQLGLLDYFDAEHIAISGDLGIRKPNPDIFLHALQGLEMKPEETVMVGDSLRADIAGGNALNMVTVWKPALYYRSEIRNALLKQKGYAALTQQEASTPEEDVDLDALHIDHINDDYLLSYISEKEAQRAGSLPENSTPTFTIKDLSELLPLFSKAGPQ